MTYMSLEWADADRELRAEAAARTLAGPRPRTKESKPMGTKLTFNQEVCQKLGITADSTADEVMSALNAALAKPKRAEVKTASPAPPSESDQAYEDVWGAAAPEKLSPDADAAYEAVWGKA